MRSHGTRDDARTELRGDDFEMIGVTQRDRVASYKRMVTKTSKRVRRQSISRFETQLAS